jgi:hypothetical protein
MAVPESSTPPQLIAGVSTEIAKLVNATRLNVAASLAAALLARTNGPMTPQQVLELHVDFYYALFPDAGSGTFQAWQKTRTERMAKEYR